jgi:NAD(P)-dependent dehydrogenase (short-subunit alcohol dehydrogenase family)
VNSGTEPLLELFSLRGKVAVVTGGTGTLGGEIARGLARAGARVCVLGRRIDRGERVAKDIQVAGGEAVAVQADVLDVDSLQKAHDEVLARWQRLDILVNAAGGNVPGAIVETDAHLFALPPEAFREVFDLNVLGTLLPIQSFGRNLVENDSGGSIVNVSSMAASRPLTKAVGYSAAKAAVDNFTKWLAVEIARKYGEGVRVNAIAPGFFVGEQNRDLLLNEDGSLTERGRDIVEHTPYARFGEPEELVGTVIWLCSPAARFVNGVVIPVDGGFSAFAGV